MDRKKLNAVESEIKLNVANILKHLNIEETLSNIETPNRVARMFSRELFSSVGKPTSELGDLLTVFRRESKKEGVVRVKNIPYHSMCEHHLLPFFGKCDIEYIPGNYILGLSKFARVVDFFCRKPQVQERLTDEIGEFLVHFLRPKYLKITLRDTIHTCVMVRGVEKECETDTEYEYRDEEEQLECKVRYPLGDSENLSGIINTWR